MSWKPIDCAPVSEDVYFLGWDGNTMDKTWVGWKDDAQPVYVRADWTSWNPTHWMPLPDPPEAFRK